MTANKRTPIRSIAAGLALLVAVGVCNSAVAQRDFSAVEIETTRVAENIYALAGAGGNIGLFAGASNAFLVDAQFAPLTEKILTAIGQVTDKPVQFVVNTHWHGDHTGGNENFAAAGAILVAHDNVRQRMSREQILPLFNQNTPPSPLGALPVVTFEDDMTFHVDGETIRVVHVANAHTDGDAIVVFENANVIHLGDTFWNGFYPRIDAGAGGSVQGVIAAIEAALEQGDAQSQYIPGHGPLPERGPDAVRAYLEMLYAVRGAVQELVDQGLSEDAVVAARPTRSFDEQWGEGGMSPEVFSRIVYRSLVQ